MIHLMPDWIMVALEITALVGGLLGGIASVVVWVTRNALVTKTDLNERFSEHNKAHTAIDTRLSDGNQRVAVIENELQHLPKADDIKELTNRVGAVEQTMSGFGAQLDGLREVLERVERPLNVLIDHQLKRGD
jgi:hypothetical protein